MTELAIYAAGIAETLEHRVTDTPLKVWLAELAEALIERANQHGNCRLWEAALEDLPHIAGGTLTVDSVVEANAAGNVSDEERRGIEKSLRSLIPWRKGPFRWFGLEVDAEWRSDLKWNRVAAVMSPLRGRQVADVGCGNGYYMWRMWGAGASFIAGFDPGVLQLMQFRAMQRYCPGAPIVMLPWGDTVFANGPAAFDTVFSMGVLYHRRDPGEHLQHLRNILRRGGELVLETLVVEGRTSIKLDSKQRYAGMRNVWMIPSIGEVESMVRSAGFERVRCADVSVTSIGEQRQTAWMPYHSLLSALDREYHGRTVEGYPAPTRAIFVAEAN